MIETNAQHDDAITQHDDATVQIAHLRAQVEALMKERVTPALTEMAGRAESVVNSATGAVRDQAQMISGHVREQPLIAVLLAAGIGYLLGRATR
jgi:ElaB/YqjD/DUF883 family membrane-anchored ribosome-binding protein